MVPMGHLVETDPAERERQMREWWHDPANRKTVSEIRAQRRAAGLKEDPYSDG